jgi:3-oxoacyl-[acyl-carrier-protein] synthase III
MNFQALKEQPRQVFDLALKSINSFVNSGLPPDLSHLVVATSCPDMLAPSLGQMINEKYHELFSDCHSIDIVQGCAGGLTALILGSQLAELNKSSVLVIQADAAKKAASSSKDIHKIFGNGSFACIMKYVEDKHGLIHYKSRQYKNLSEVVTIKLGHDADYIIMKELKDWPMTPGSILDLL